MDLQTALICGGVAAISAIVIYVTSVFSMREKTYEEAIAEQRKLPEENLLLGRSSKDKAKDKKQKKLGKKVKEKSADQEKTEHANLTSKPSAVQISKYEEVSIKVSVEPPKAPAKSATKMDAPVAFSKREKEKAASVKVVNAPIADSIAKVPAQKTDRAQVPNKQDRMVFEKDKDSAAKQTVTKAEKSEKTGTAAVTEKSLKQTVLKTDKTEKQTSVKVEKIEKQTVLKSEKQTIPKMEKQTVQKAEKSEKQAIPKGEKSEKQVIPVGEKPEKPATSKIEKSERNAFPDVEKVTVVKTEKGVGKIEKGFVEKGDKPALSKVEKNSNAKPEKSVSLVSSTAKQDKSVSTKSDKQSDAKADKSGNVQNGVSDSASTPAVAETASSVPSAQPAVRVTVLPIAVPVKEKNRRKKSELAALQQMSGEKDGVNMSLLLPIVQKAELSRSEIQILIDQLLNKQQNAGISDAEWIEGRQDPVQKLKKQLAEKEKALAEEQEASQGVQAKLKELRQELNAERSRLSHSCRQLEEALLAKSNEAQALTARLQHSQDAVNSEKQAHAHQVQQLQQKLNEEHVRLLQLQEQEASLQQELLAQRQQMMSHLSEQEGALKAQVTQLMSQLKEQETLNSSLSLELQSDREQHLSENNLLHERVVHAEKQALLFKDSADRVQELSRQVEELNMIREDLEHQLNAQQQHENALQFEASNLRKEVEELKAQLVGYEALKNDSNRLRSDNDKLANQLLQITDLQLENQRLRDENERLASQVVILPELQREALQLREENETLAAQVTAMTERPAAEGRENGDVQFHEEKQDLHKCDFTLFEKAIQQKEGQLMQMSGELEEKSCLLKKLQSEIISYKTDISNLSEELEEQRKKNNEIRLKINEEHQNVIKQRLQRIFPYVRVQDCKMYEQWLDQFESSATKVFSELQSQSQLQIQSQASSDNASEIQELEKQNSHLQGLVANYKTIIDDTSGMLKQLQNQVEEGEIRWRQQLQVKEAELEAVRQELVCSVAASTESNSSIDAWNKVEDLQAKLKIKDQQQQDLETKFKNLSGSVEQMKEEKELLSAQLQEEQEKSQDLSKELVRLRSLVQIGKDSLNQEHEMVVSLQQQVDKLNGVHQNRSAASNGPYSESSTAAQSYSASLQPLSETASFQKGTKSKKKKGGSGKK